jgi:selenocysteine lyase/cysteine desulfurase
VSGLVSALQFRGERNRIVISENEFPTIGQIAHAQELRGAEVVQVEPRPEAFASAIDERTALVASTFVSFRTGAVHDVEAIYGLAREHGALMLVDGYQGIGALPLEASKVGDVVVGGTVKYLLASAGLSFMALRPGLVEELVPVQTGWFADENVFDMQIERYRPHRSARRFDAGTPPVPNIYGGLAGVRLIAEAGVPAIAEHVRGLVARLRAGIDELGASVAAEPRGPLVCIRSTDAPALVAALAEERIVTSERDSNLRVSLHLYNTEDDVDAVLAALARNRALLA